MQNQSSTDSGIPSQSSGQSTPDSYSHPGYDYQLQAIMELKGSMGELTSSVNSLKESIDKQETKLDCLEGKVASISNKIIFATAIFIVFIAIGGFVFNIAKDMMLIAMEKNVVTNVETPGKQKALQETTKPTAIPPTK